MASSSSRKRFGCVCVGVCIRTSYRPRPRLHSMNILDVIGATPMIDLGTGVAGARPGDRIRLLGKLEGNNPAGSVKDRPARSMIVSAEARGDLRRGVRLIEPTSGNTGIALAMIAAARGYAIELVMPENATAERVAVMRAFGGHVVLTPAAGGREQAIDHARAKVSAGGYLMLDQFANPDNPLAHYETTGPEIWSGSAGQVTHFVSAMGTMGTIMGGSRLLKEQRREIVRQGRRGLRWQGLGRGGLGRARSLPRPRRGRERRDRRVRPLRSRRSVRVVTALRRRPLTGAPRAPRASRRWPVRSWRSDRGHGAPTRRRGESAVRRAARRGAWPCPRA